MTAVAEATTYISQRLETGFFNPVSHKDVNEIAAKFDTLTGAEAAQVIDNLESKGLLDDFARESVDGEWFGRGGFSQTERQQFFADMAKKLDGDTLGKLMDQYVATDANGHSGRHRAQELATAIATQASPQTKIDFIESQSGSLVDQSTANDIGMTSFSTKGDSNALAVGTVLGSLRGAHAEQAFGMLSSKEMDAVFETSVSQQTITSSSHYSSNVSVNWETGTYSNLLAAAASMQSADAKANVFDAAGDTLSMVRDSSGVFAPGINRDQALESMTDSLTKLLDSDTAGIVSELNLNNSTKDGSDLSAYAQQMLAQGNEKQLGEMMAKLQFGNNLDQDPVQYLYGGERTIPNTGGDTILPRAEALGYFTGAVSVGAEAVTKDVEARREMVDNVIGSVISIVSWKVGDAGKGLVGLALGEGQGMVKYALEEAIADPTADAGTKLALAALPINDQGEPAVGQQVSDAFGGAYERVDDHARP